MAINQILNKEIGFLLISTSFVGTTRSHGCFRVPATLQATGKRTALCVCVCVLHPRPREQVEIIRTGTKASA